jgi:hypothetical protein
MCCLRAGVHVAGQTVDVRGKQQRQGSSEALLGTALAWRSGQQSMCETRWPGTHGGLGSVVSSEDSGGGSVSSSIGVGGLLRRACSKGEEIWREHQAVAVE